MAPLPTAHIIHASDAPQHLGKLKEILEKLKAENRIADFITLSPDNSLTSLQDQVREDDLVITLLTYNLEPRKEEIESMLREVKTQTPGLKIAEIIVDHVPYENEFITFPADLKPIRSREDMDAVWNDIEQNLKQMFPAESISEEPQKDSWKKYLKYAIPAIIIIVLLLWWKPWERKVVADFTANTTECEVPCEVSFENNSKNADNYEWNFGDGTIISEVNPSHTFDSPGSYTVTLVASKNGQHEEDTQTINITANASSDFPGGSRRVYSADFSEWPTKDSEHGSVSLGFGNSLVLQPSSNVWIGSGRAIDIPALEGDFVFDVRFQIEERNPSSSLNFDLTGGGTDARRVTVFFIVWREGNVVYSLTKDRVRSGGGLGVPHVITEETIAKREPLPLAIEDHDWSQGNKLTLKREGGRMQFFVNDIFVKEFSVSRFPVKKTSIGTAFESKVVVTSIEARTRD